MLGWKASSIVLQDALMSEVGKSEIIIVTLDEESKQKFSSNIFFFSMEIELDVNHLVSWSAIILSLPGMCSMLRQSCT